MTCEFKVIIITTCNERINFYLKVLNYSRIQSPKESIGRGVWHLSFE